MRWEQQRVDFGQSVESQDAVRAETAALDLDLGALPERRGVPDGGGRAGLRLPDPVPIESGTDDAFAIEIRAKSIINRVPSASQVPFRWTINPYRGCGHACRYCFARNTHTYLDLDSGRDFDSKIVVKVNAAELARRELADPKWRREPIAMGTNTDPYQRADGVYRLMPGILAALRDHANPFSVLTKGTLILRDLDLYRQAAQVTDVSVAVSIGSLDEQLWRVVEPGTPSPRRRLDVIRRFGEIGIGCSVLMAPILPGLSDSDEQIDETVHGLMDAGATNVTPLVLHLRSGAREWYHHWLQDERPDLLPLYERLYRRGAYPPKSYQDDVVHRVREAQRRYGGRTVDDREQPARAHRGARPRAAVPSAGGGAARQLSLL
ncbi:radical SAM protein [Allosaccharopolyspora coralli]|uniref:Radical SAM protein n=1 Tax=Allosaccharopolyspora coralli TaxID=2665642 RepID=A0A5Q3Q8W0_9PSEU|nr:Rv2578c family radical SAM protein [Allosaccharopolyspora coralli]QGK69644.1 radical SAM protein [Allosaccharopolyspora coralli]